MAQELTDARGVKIEPGDTVIYGFGVDSSVAMAEGVVIGEEVNCDCDDHNPEVTVSLTPQGRVRVRVVRRSYRSGTKPVVDIMPNRLVVLKPLECRIPGSYGDPETGAILPPSPQPTQDETAVKELKETIARYERDIETLVRTGTLTGWTDREDGPTYTAEYLIPLFCKWLRAEQSKLKKIKEMGDR
jgi:hypothetical protein